MMKTRETRAFVALIILMSLTVSGFSPAAAQETERDTSQPVYLRLKVATFDPLAGEPALPSNLQQDAYPEPGEGAYIVQFRGPIREEWPPQLQSLGAQVVDYLPDYAFLVWMDGVARAKVEGLDTVRWVGLYQPAYKLSPNLDRAKPLYRVVLFAGSDLAAVEARLKDLETPTISVPDEQFTLVLPDGNVEEVAAWPEVLWIENRPLHRAMNDVASGIMNAPTAWSSSYTGSDMTVTVADSGIDSGVDGPGADMHPDFDNRLAHIRSWPVPDDGCGGCCWNANANDGAADLDSGHGTHVLGSVAGNGAASGGQIKGLAYQASLTFQAVEQWVDFTPLCEGPPYFYTDGYYLVGLPDDLTQLFQEAYNWGSRVHSNSWGSDANGEYTAASQAVDQFVWDHPKMVILFSAGNAGVDANSNGYVDQDSLGSPGTAKNCITSGASDNERTSGGLASYTWGQVWPGDFPANPTHDDLISDNREELAAFSSRGPTDDGRTKPDLVAPGTNILSVRSSQAANASAYWWGPYNDDYMYFGGTSMSNPLIAGAATLVREYYIEGRGHPNPSAALVKATLINSAVDIAGYGAPGQEAAQPIPNNHEGWGRVDVGAATTGQRKFHDWNAVTAGFSTIYYHNIGLSSIPLKVTLAWSDRPASLPAGGLVNNLDLEVEAPDHTIYRGNYFSNGWSLPGGSADNANNVESVYIHNPAVGQWTVRVTGANVPQGSQQFALILTGWFGPPPDYDNTIYLPLIAKN